MLCGRFSPSNFAISRSLAVANRITKSMHGRKEQRPTNKRVCVHDCGTWDIFHAIADLIDALSMCVCRTPCSPRQPASHLKMNRRNVYCFFFSSIHWISNDSQNLRNSLFQRIARKMRRVHLSFLLSVISHNSILNVMHLKKIRVCAWMRSHVPSKMNVLKSHIYDQIIYWMWMGYYLCILNRWLRHYCFVQSQHINVTRCMQCAWKHYCHYASPILQC